MINCIDISECASSPCHANATCTNVDGLFTCKCDDGYEGDGVMICQGALKSTIIQDWVTKHAYHCFSTAIVISSSIDITPSNSQRDLIIASTVGAVAFLLLITIVVVVVCVCYFIRYSGITKKKSDLYVTIVLTTCLLTREFSFSFITACSVDLSFPKDPSKYDDCMRTSYMQTSLDAVDHGSFPRIIFVQSSYKLNLPPYLLIHAANIKLVEPIGQGDSVMLLLCVCSIHDYPACMCRGKVIGRSVHLSVCCHHEIARSRDLGIWATHKHN